MPRPDRHNEVELNLLAGGSLTYLIWGQRVTVHGRRLAAFWAAIPHQIIDFGDVDSYFVATVPLAWVLAWNLPGDLVRRLLHGEVVQEKEEARAQTARTEIMTTLGVIFGNRDFFPGHLFTIIAASDSTAETRGSRLTPTPAGGEHDRPRDQSPRLRRR